MAEHFRSFHPDTDEYAQRVLEPSLGFTHRQLVDHGTSLIQLLGGELVSEGAGSQEWRFATPNNIVRLTVDEPDIVIPAILKFGDIGLFYTYTGYTDQLWTPDAKFIPADVDTGNHEQDSLVILGEALFAATATTRVLGRLASRISAPVRDLVAKKKWSPSQERTKAEIASHYDLTQEVYTGPLGFLDKGYVQYSSGLLLPGQEFESLDQLQQEKVDSLARKLELESADTLLEVGSGWGGLAVALAQRAPNIHITSVTVSDEQLARARQRAEAAGVADRVTFLGQDYRDLVVEQPFDRVVSVEMIEAVDWRDLGTYFDSLVRFVNPDNGVIVLQSINIKPEVYAHQRHHKSFANTAIFPGGSLVSREEISSQMSKRGWRLHEATELGPSYALTLREWMRKLHANKPEISKNWLSRPDIEESAVDRFYRGFSFYLAMSEAGFRPQTDHLQDWQLTYRPDNILDN